ncbi:MAG: tRNA uridine-5-carboxymethylaminomethyl(34) synthesis GTPase MnmE [Candidatus Babeliales bacterium]
MNPSSSTIIALCTAQGPGALAIIRLSGNEARRIANKRAIFLSKNKNLLSVPSHTIHFGSIRDKNGSLIDQVLFLVMDAPHSFTGENTIEISCHNNPFIIQSILEAYLLEGAQLAENGAFTRRALENGKLDLLQAEAINELIHAQTQQALSCSLAQLTGTLSYWLKELEKKFLTALCFTETNFEFIEEEGHEFGETIRTLVDTAHQDILTIKKNISAQTVIRNGVRVALIGSVNAGKSSLFNALIGSGRAIVTNIPGTTRDVIEGTIYTKQTFITFCDTAGIRNTNNCIEQEGITRSYQEAHKADCILCVVDKSRQLTNEEAVFYRTLLSNYSEKIIIIFNKTDIEVSCPNFKDLFAQYRQECPLIAVSCKTGANIQIVQKNIEKKIEKMFTSFSSPFLLNKRQQGLLLQLEHATDTLKSMLQQKKIPYELVSCHIQELLCFITELSGHTISEQTMDTIFKSFCVGK